MNNLDYIKMSDRELKQYLLSHKDDREAFYAYLDRKHQHPKQTILSVNELETLTSEEKIIVVRQRLQEKFGI
jgi:hypothetical protein